MKNNIGFFTHEVVASEHRKFLILRTYYGEGDRGWAAEGRFWRLNSLIGKANNCKIDLNLKGEKARIAHELGMGMKDLEEFLVVLSVESELIHNDDGVIWTDQTQEDLSRATAMRKDSKTRYEAKKPVSAEKPESTTEKSKFSDQNLYRAEQSREERKKEQAGEIELVDKSVDNLPVCDFPDEEEPPAARSLVDIKIIKDKIASAPFRISLPDSDLKDIADRISILGLSLEFVDYCMTRSSTGKNPAALFRKGIMTYSEWVDDFRDPRPKKPPEKSTSMIPDVRHCPECGKRLSSDGDCLNIKCPVNADVGIDFGASFSRREGVTA